MEGRKGKLVDDNVATVKTLLANVSKSLGAVGQSRGKGGSFNVFRLCQIDHYENAHSRILADFLDPRGMHGMDDTFLTLFLRQPIIAEYLEQQGFPKDDGFHGWDKLGTAMVVTEEAFAEGRCDIAIHWRGWCIIIENKIFASDQAKQLKRYAKAVCRTGEKPIILYLTLDGHPAGADSAGTVEYKCISYRKEIANWITDCIGEIEDWSFGFESELPDCSRVRETLCQYQQLVKEISGSQEELKVNDETVTELVASTDAFRSACRISNTLQNARARIAQKIMEALRLELAERPVFNGWLLKDELASLLLNNERYTGFWIEREAGDRPYDIYCEFQARGALRDMFVGLASDDRRWKDAVPFLHAAEKFEKLKLHYSFYSEDNPGWLYGCWPHDKELRSWSDDLLARAIDADFCREFARKIANSLQTLLEEAEEVDSFIRKESKK